uniref:Uncharacterized protein n=1 Tax=Equus asinus TaxID=9793 RepID=A0A9L0JUJ9_EQUAS
MSILFFCYDYKWDCILDFSFYYFININYRNATNICMLILYSATLLYPLIISSGFLIYLEFSMYGIMSSTNNELTSSFPIWIPFISSSCLIALPRPSNIMLNKSGESGHPGLIPFLRGILFSLSLSSMMLAVDLSCIAFIMLRCFPSIPVLLRAFIING